MLPMREEDEIPAVDAGDLRADARRVGGMEKARHVEARFRAIGRRERADIDPVM
jgi:hypothetical protein